MYKYRVLGIYTSKIPDPQYRYAITDHNPDTVYQRFVYRSANISKFNCVSFSSPHGAPPYLKISDKDGW